MRKKSKGELAEEGINHPTWKGGKSPKWERDPLSRMNLT